MTVAQQFLASWTPASAGLNARLSTFPTALSQQGALAFADQAARNNAILNAGLQSSIQGAVNTAAENTRAATAMNTAFLRESGANQRQAAEQSWQQQRLEEARRSERLLANLTNSTFSERSDTAVPPSALDLAIDASKAYSELTASIDRSSPMQQYLAMLPQALRS